MLVAEAETGNPLLNYIHKALGCSVFAENVEDLFLASFAVLIKHVGHKVLGKVKKYVRNGSIITFHDSIKSEKNLKYALPKAIEWLLEQGYEFKVFD